MYPGQQLAQRNEQTNPQTVQNVKDLVQQLIDDRIPAQLFTERLQTELQSTPQVITVFLAELKLFNYSHIWCHFYAVPYHYYAVACNSPERQISKQHQIINNRPINAQ